MAHFAELDADGRVVRVIVFDGEGVNGEAACAAFMARAEGGDPGTWKQTSYNGTIRSCFAGIGYAYDAEGDAFVPPDSPETE